MGSEYKLTDDQRKVVDEVGSGTRCFVCNCLAYV
jgi:hypothetical protein